MFDTGSPLKTARAGGHVYGVLAERREGDDLQRHLARGGEHHVGCGSVVVGAPSRRPGLLAKRDDDGAV